MRDGLFSGGFSGTILAMVSSPVDAIKVKFFTFWVPDVVVAFIFVGYCLDSSQGFRWWMDPTTYGFAIINIILAIKSLALLILRIVQYKIAPAETDQEYTQKIKFPITDIIFHLNNLAFWLVSAIFAFSTVVTPERLVDPDWRKSTGNLRDTIYILPVIKLIIDFINTIVALIFQPFSEARIMGSSQIWYDLQYLFIYLYLSSKAPSFTNFFIIFVWIYMLAILGAAFGCCLLCMGIISMVSGQKQILQGLMFVFLSLAGILFFVWATIVGDGKAYTKGRAPTSHSRRLRASISYCW